MANGVAALSDWSAVDLAAALRRRDISAVELLQSCLARIEACNPTLNALIAIDRAGAETAAARADAALRAREPVGCLHGLPIAVKDLSETAGLVTSFGSLLFKDRVPARDELMVARLRRAGAIILAKSNTPEFGAGANTRNRLHGATGNPFNPTLTCAGSSGGSAVALASGMVPLATGSDMGGSLRTPAAFCGVTGLRPSPGLVPSDRRQLGWSALSVDGPMARNAADAGLFLSAMAGDDGSDPLSYPVDAAGFAELPEIDLGSLRVAISEDLGFAPVAREIRRTFQAKMTAMRSVFRTLEARDPPLGDADRTFAVLRAEGFMGGLRGFYETHPDLLGPPVISNIQEAQRYSLRDRAEAALAQTVLYRQIQEMFQTVDLLICPTAAVSPFPHQEWAPTAIDGQPLAAYYHWIAITYGLSLTGHPVIAVPCGLDPHGMPFGIQIMGPRRSDRFLLGVAAALERAFAADPLLNRPVPPGISAGVRP